MYYLIDYNDNTHNVVTLSMIYVPRQNEYCVGDRVVARYPGMAGLFDGTIAGKDGKVYLWHFNFKLRKVSA